MLRQVSDANVVESSEGTLAVPTAPFDWAAAGAVSSAIETAVKSTARTGAMTKDELRRRGKQGIIMAGKD